MSGPEASCTPAHCTWGELGAMYSSAPFFAGLAAIAVFALVLWLLRRALGRR